MKANPCEGEGRDIGDRDTALGRKQREKGGSRGQDGRATSRNQGAEKPPDWQIGLTYCAACAQCQGCALGKPRWAEHRQQWGLEVCVSTTTSLSF